MQVGMQPVPFWSEKEVEAAIPPTIEHLNSRKLLAYPTETVYGFGSAVDHESVQELIRFKGRPQGKPFLLLVSNGDMIARLGVHLTPSASILAARFWPGPLTLVLPGGEKRVPIELRGPEGGIAVRWTPHPAISRLIAAYGDPITSTSANLPGSPPATSAGEIARLWPQAVLSGALRVLDGGHLSVSQPSTVVDCTGSRPRVIRPGAVAASLLRESVPTLVGDS